MVSEFQKNDISFLDVEGVKNYAREIAETHLNADNDSENNVDGAKMLKRIEKEIKKYYFDGSEGKHKSPASATKPSSRNRMTNNELTGSEKAKKVSPKPVLERVDEIKATEKVAVDAASSPSRDAKETPKRSRKRTLSSTVTSNLEDTPGMIAAKRKKMVGTYFQLEFLHVRFILLARLYHAISGNIGRHGQKRYQCY
jgi:hypothetical protein